MSAGVPVLVTGSQIDVIDGGSTGRLLGGTDPNMIAENVIALLEDHSTWSALSKNSKDFSKRFSSENAALITLEALKKAVNRIE